MTRFRSPGSRPDTWWRFGIAALSVAIVVKHFAPTIADPDLWGHVLFGQLAGAAGWIPRFDPYSYLSAGHEWINHEWLAEHVFAVVFETAGSPGLVGLKLTVAVTIVALLLWHVRERGLDLLRGAVLVIFLAIPLLVGLRTVRPHLFTYFLFAIMLLVLERSEGTRGRMLLLLPPLFALWVNFHGGVLAGLAVVGLWGGVRTLRALWSRYRSGPEPPPPNAWALIAVFLVSAAATLVNPYGMELLEFLVRTATVPRPFISEWQPLGLRSIWGGVWLVGVALATWVLVRSERRPRPEAFTVLIVLMLLPLTAVRHLPFTFLGIAILAAPSFASLWGTDRDSVGREGPAHPDRSARAGWIGAGLTVMAVVVFVRVGEDLSCITIEPDAGVEYPARATLWLQNSGVEANLINHFNHGEYLIWHLAPRIRVSMDGRRETVYPDSVYDAYMNFQRGSGEWDRYLSYGEPELAMLPTGIPAENLMEMHPDWRAIHEDSLVRVFAVRGSRAAEVLEATPVPEDVPADGEGLCFP